MDRTATVAILPGMGKKKSGSGRHTTPRHALQIPKDWFVVAQAMAAESKMLTTWFLIDLIREAAQARGRDNLPPVPWDAPPTPSPRPRPGGRKP